MSVLLSLSFLHAGYPAVSYTVVPADKWARMKENLQNYKYTITLPDESAHVEEITGEELVERIDVTSRREVLKAYYTLYESESHWVGFDYFRYILKETDELERKKKIERQRKSNEAIPFARASLQKAGALEKTSTSHDSFSLFSKSPSSPSTDSSSSSESPSSSSSESPSSESSSSTDSPFFHFSQSPPPSSESSSDYDRLMRSSSPARAMSPSPEALYLLSGRRF